MKREFAEQSQLEFEDEKFKMELKKENLDYSNGVPMLKQVPIAHFTNATNGQREEILASKEEEEPIVCEEDMDKLCSLINKRDCQREVS